MRYFRRGDVDSGPLARRMGGRDKPPSFVLQCVLPHEGIWQLSY